MKKVVIRLTVLIGIILFFTYYFAEESFQKLIEVGGKDLEFFIC